MNEKIQIFFIGFIGALSILFPFILSSLIRKNKQRTNSNVGKRIKQTETTCESAKGTAENLAGTTESAIRTEQDIERTNQQLADSIDTSERILEELKKRHN